MKTEITSLKFLRSGKVRDIYEIDDEKLLIVQTDRISVFDHVLPTNIPGKGEILTSVSNFWFDMLKMMMPTHYLDIDPKTVVQEDEIHLIENRSIVVKKLTPVPIEVIVRRRLTGSAWRDYVNTGTVCGINLPSGLTENEPLDYLLFTPSTKSNEHDINITYNQAAEIIGLEALKRIKSYAMIIFENAEWFLDGRGISLVDTKFEFGFDKDGTITLMDEVLTPDSSRYLDKETGESYDKQFVRNWVKTHNLYEPKDIERLTIPQNIVNSTVERYKKLEQIILDKE